MKLYLKTSDFFLSKESFELHYDDDLDMLVTHPQPKELDRYYASDNYVSHSDGNTSSLEKVYQAVKKINLQRKFNLINKYTKGNKSLLDVGAGTGDFLVYAQNKGWNVSGMEPNKQARELAKTKGIFLIQDLEELVAQKQTYEIITLWHVLEHMPNLEESISTLYALLGKGGTLVIAVPNFKSYDAKKYGSFWAAYDVPRHLWHFSKTAISKLFAKQHMKLIQTKPMWFDAFYVSLLSEQYKNGRKNWLRAMWTGVGSNVKGFFTKEYSSHIYILKKSD